jgi:AcrR family transcriptional regulator
MSKVANTLGFTTMSLYRHVANKDELLLLMWDRAFGPPPGLPAPAGWRKRLEHWAREHRASCLRHPWVLQMTVNGPPMGPGQLGWLDRGLQALEDTPLSEGDKANVVLLVSVYVLGQTRVTVDVTAAYEAGAQRGDTDLDEDFALTLGELVDPERFPALARAYAGGAFSDPDEGLDEDFTFGLERILDGVQARIATREGLRNIPRRG